MAYSCKFAKMAQNIKLETATDRDFDKLLTEGGGTDIATC